MFDGTCFFLIIPAIRLPSWLLYFKYLFVRYRKGTRWRLILSNERNDWRSSEGHRGTDLVYNMSTFDCVPCAPLYRGIHEGLVQLKESEFWECDGSRTSYADPVAVRARWRISGDDDFHFQPCMRCQSHLYTLLCNKLSCRISRFLVDNIWAPWKCRHGRNHSSICANTSQRINSSPYRIYEHSLVFI